ncbi:MAG: TonB-dependent receptor [Candidatus Eremiobacteraeota bacterium]|nr:TonB-dependent receptor [Candidatus Eremiobacteraeota bacterium]
MRALAIVALSCFLALAASSAARAQNVTPGDILVVVTDGIDHKPIDNAEVFLLGGDASRSSLTDAHGRLVFSSVQPGNYAIRVQRENYLRTDVASFDVGEGQHVHINVSLASTLRVITSVTARSTVDISAETVGEQSPEREVSDSLRSALGKLAGVDAGDDTYGPDSVFNISLRNHDASQTGYSIDGIRIVGQSQGLLGAGQDLFTGANVSFAPVAGYAGGTINFSTLRPTKEWKFGFSNTVGSYGAASTGMSATGAVTKRLRVAAQHVRSARDAFLSGYTYEDQSGTSYLHEGANSSVGDLVKIAYDISKVTSLSASSYIANGTFSPICPVFTTAQACGQGPGAQSRSRNSFSSLELDTLAGNTQISFSAGLPQGSYTYANLQRTTNGLSSPYFSTNEYHGASLGLNASATSRHHTFSVNLSHETY